jgi:hypothetical protein
VPEIEFRPDEWTLIQPKIRELMALLREYNAWGSIPTSRRARAAYRRRQLARRRRNRR